VWDPNGAIFTVGTAVCACANQLKLKTKADDNAVNHVIFILLSFSPVDLNELEAYR
jgi:hypothetical protein